MPDSFGFNGVAFSPNSRFLYATAYTVLYQFDLSALDIGLSKSIIAWWMHPSLAIKYKTLFYQARLAPDGKIYISGSNNSQHLHIIHKPNCSGEQCDFEQYAVEMKSINAFTMPNFPHFRTWSESDTCEVVDTQTPTNEQRTVKIFPNPTLGQISWIGLDERTVIIRVLNLLGQILMERNAAGNSVDMGILPAGVYHLQLLSQDRKTIFNGIVSVVK